MKESKACSSLRTETRLTPVKQYSHKNTRLAAREGNSTIKHSIIFLK